jgi:hypothetical protein
VAEVIVGYHCRVYVHVDPDAGALRRVVVDDTSAADPTYVDGPAELEAGAIALAERADWPAWELGW